MQSTLRKISLYLFLFCFPGLPSAQEEHGQHQSSQKQDQQPSMPDMPGMDMHHHHMGSGMEMEQQPTTFIEKIEQHGASGTDAQPNSTPVPMLMTMKGKWMLMLQDRKSTRLNSSHS